MESQPVQGCITGANEVTKKTSTVQASKVTPGRASPKSKKPPLVEKANQASESGSLYTYESNSDESQHQLESTSEIIQAKATKVTEGPKKPVASGKYFLNFRLANLVHTLCILCFLCLPCASFGRLVSALNSDR